MDEGTFFFTLLFEVFAGMKKEKERADLIAFMKDAAA